MRRCNTRDARRIETKVSRRPYAHNARAGGNARRRASDFWADLQSRRQERLHADKDENNVRRTDYESARRVLILQATPDNISGSELQQDCLFSSLRLWDFA